MATGEVGGNTLVNGSHKAYAVPSYLIYPWIVENPKSSYNTNTFFISLKVAADTCIHTKTITYMGIQVNKCLYLNEAQTQAPHPLGTPAVLQLGAYVTIRLAFG